MASLEERQRQCELLTDEEAAAVIGCGVEEVGRLAKRYGLVQLDGDPRGLPGVPMLLRGYAEKIQCQAGICKRLDAMVEKVSYGLVQKSRPTIDQLRNGNGSATLRPYLNLVQTAQLLGVSVADVRKLVNAGDLSHDVDHMGNWVFFTSLVLSFRQRHEAASKRFLGQLDRMLRIATQRWGR